MRVPEAIERARAAVQHRADPSRPYLLGIAGAPGAGKSTFAARLVDDVPGAVLVPMDGCHLRSETLRQLGRLERRGAPDTFDVVGYVRLLGRVRAGRGASAPDFDRSREEPVPEAITVPPGCPLVVTEGNYLLHDAGGWQHVRPVLDEVWFVEVPEPLRVERLVARFVRYGWDGATARERVLHGSDAANAVLVAATASRADARVTP